MHSPNVDTDAKADVDFTEADNLHRDIQNFIAGHWQATNTFDFLARSLAIYQHDHTSGYARLCSQRRVDPRIDLLHSLPAIPTDAFRVARVATFPQGVESRVFASSTTTSDTPGLHFMRRLDTYRLAAITGARRLLGGMGERPRIISIVTHAKDSSLGCMLDWFVEDFGDAKSSHHSPEEMDDAIHALQIAASEQVTTLVCATAFAWVHLGERLNQQTIGLAAGSRAMQTGGFKGRSREVSPQELRTQIANNLGISPKNVCGEYGMTELSSQLYAVDCDTSSTWRYEVPPWVRVIAVNPNTLAPLPIGHRGIARIEDLANVESAWAIQTQDLVEVDESGLVTLFGRVASATSRGCSLAVEQLLGR